MTKFLIFGLIIFKTLVVSQSEKFETRISPPKEVKYHEVLETSESHYQDYSDRNFPNYDRTPRQDFEIPATFKAPHYEAHDYWRNKHDYDNRRTFLEDFSYGPPRKTTAFPGFYQFMSSIFGGGRDDVTPEPFEPFHYNQNKMTPPYGLDAPFNYRPTEPNYIPPPKPIRASVIKLETITSSPIHPSLDYETTTKYYPQSGNFYNHVIIENSKPQQNFHPHNSGGLKIPSFKPLPVLPKPGYAPATTLRPTHPEIFNNHSHYFHYNKTDYKYPESVQDQLPHLTGSELKIPYVSEKSIPQIFNPLLTESPKRQSTYDFYPPTDPQGTTNILGLIDIRSLNLNAEKKERPTDVVTEVKSFPGAVEKVNRPTFIKKLTAQLDRSSVERITNLTIQGYSKPDKKAVNVQHVNYLNIRNLINHQLNKPNNTDNTNKTSDSFSRPVNINDELSLDAKILKDTNWDGWTMMEMPKETTTFRVVLPNQRNKTAFWEVAKPQTTTESDLTTEATTTEQTRFSTTTEFIFWTSTQEVTETSTVQETTPTEAQRRFEQESLKLEDSEDTDVNVETTTPKRRYNRRPKITNFTPYPSAEEVQKKLIQRNHFLKRQKPNITLSFGNKNVLKNRQSFGTDEVMKFSDEDVQKRRKIGKRRQVIKRHKLPMSERPV